MTTGLPMPELGLTPDEAQKKFDQLQKKLQPLWKSIQSLNQDEQTIVVVPSMTMDTDMLKGSELQAYEERIVGEEIKSPSVQLRVNPLGKVELLSTHDQLLGGPSGQTYLGCRFPANPAYAAMITREAAKVGERLAKEGVIGRFALDFVVVRSKNGKWA